MFCRSVLRGTKKTKSPQRKKNEKTYSISFRFSGFKPTENGSFGPAKAELKAAYPLIQNVSFLGLRKDSNKLHGWVNFLNPKDCSTTFSLMEKNPIQGIKPEKLGEMREAEFATSLTNPPVKPLPRKQPEFKDFSENVQDCGYKCF